MVNYSLLYSFEVVGSEKLLLGCEKLLYRITFWGETSDRGQRGVSAWDQANESNEVLVHILSIPNTFHH